MSRPAIAILAVTAMLAFAGCSREDEGRHLIRARSFLDKQDYARALIEFKNAAHAKPLDAEPYYQIGLVYLKLENPALAASSFKRATQLNPGHSDAQVKLAELMSGSGDRELLREAEGQMKAVLSRTKDNIDALNVLALLEWNLGRKDAAQQLLYEAFQKSPNPTSATQLARMKLQNKDLKGAEEVLKSAVVQQPKAIPLVLLMAEFYAAVGKLGDAEREYQQVLAAEPKNAKALEEAGALYVAEGRVDLADSAYRQLAGLPAERWKTAHAQFLLQTGRKQPGIEELEALWKSAPQERTRRTLLVGAYLQDGRVTEAQRILDRALKENKDDSEALFQKGIIDLSNGEIERATSRLEAVLAHNPDSAETHYFVGKVHQLRGASSSYKRELNRAVALKPDLLAARIDLAKELLAQNGGTAALQLMNSTPSWQRGALPAIVERNWTLLATDRKAEMRAEVDRGLELARIPELLVQDAILLLQADNKAAATRSAEEALKLDADSLAALTILVAIDRTQRQSSKALARVQAYAGEHPAAASAQYLLGELLLEAGQSAEARRAFLAAKMANPGFLTAPLALASLDLEEGRLDEARNTLTELLARQPSNSDGLSMLAAVDDRQGRYADAVRRYQAVLEWDSTNVPVLNNLAYILADRLHRADEALQYAERAKQVSPHDAIVDDTLGWVLYRKGLYSMAVENLKNSVARQATPRRQLHLAMAYYKAGAVTQARDLLQGALPQARDLPEAAEAIQVIQH